MNDQYLDTVRLMLAVAPDVFDTPHFAMKGGTAINMFVQDLPRLSVDIDVIMRSHGPNRAEALSIHQHRTRAQSRRLSARAITSLSPAPAAGTGAMT